MKPFARRSRSCLAGLALFACVSPSANAEALDDLIAALKSRAARTSSIHATLHVSSDGDARFSRFQNEWAPLNHDVEFDAAELVIQGHRVRFDGTGWCYDQHTIGMPPYDYEKYEGDSAELRDDLAMHRFQHALNARFDQPEQEWRDPQRFTGVFDGERRTSFWDADQGQFPRFRILPPPDHSEHRAISLQADQAGGIDLDSLVYAPLTLHFLPLEPAFGGLDPSLCSIEGDASIRGRSCHVVLEECRTRSEVFRRRFYIDQERDWSILRYIGESDARPDVQLDIEVKHDDQLGWIPRAWTVMRIDSTERPVQNFVRVQADVQTRSMNDAVGFRIDPPAGAWVIDWAREQQRLVRGDRTTRRIIELESDVAATYEDLWNSKTGESHAAKLRRQQSRVIRALIPLCRVETAALLLGLTLCGTAVFVRRPRR